MSENDNRLPPPPQRLLLRNCAVGTVDVAQANGEPLTCMLLEFVGLVRGDVEPPRFAVAVSPYDVERFVDGIQQGAEDFLQGHGPAARNLEHDRRPG